MACGSVLFISNDEFLFNRCVSEWGEGISFYRFELERCLNTQNLCEQFDFAIFDCCYCAQVNWVYAVRLLNREMQGRLFLLAVKDAIFVKQLVGKYEELTACSLFESPCEILPFLMCKQNENPIPEKEKNYSTKQIKRSLECAINSDLPVLLTGESGSGKTWTAEYIHSCSTRKNSPFVNVNVAELNPNLVESHLFGTVKGAFTDALSASGFFEKVNGGTLFFDEIAEIPVGIQAKLLNAIESRSFRRVGSTEALSFDARFIFATNANLSELISKNAFRPDLFYRISGITVELPPLRERRDEIPYLASLFAADYKKLISESAKEYLSSFLWPGNIRQLKHSISNACMVSSGSELIVEDFQLC